MNSTVRNAAALMFFGLALLVGPIADAQRPSSDSRSGSFADFLRRMDDNRNGQLESREISDRARRFIEGLARRADLDMSRALPIRALEEAMRGYRDQRDSDRRSSGSSRDSSSTAQYTSGDDLTVPGFGQVEGKPVLGFGDDAGALAYVEQEDIERAADRIRRYDSNGDGYIDRREAREGRWSDDPFQYDYNGDGRLSRSEMAQRYARRRMAESGGSGSDSRSRGSSGGSSGDGERRREEEARRRSPSSSNRSTWSLVGSLMDRYDRDRNGRLNSGEWHSMGIDSPAADLDHNGQMDRGELYQWLLRKSETAGPALPEGLPDWFGPCDRNGDGQVSMSEFADDWDEETVDEFSQFDLNGDGIIVPEECLKAATHPAGTYANDEMQLLPAPPGPGNDVLEDPRSKRPAGGRRQRAALHHAHARRAPGRFLD